MLPLLSLCSAACLAGAAALVARLGRAERFVVAGFSVLFAASAVLSPNSYVNDHLWHFLNARLVLRDPTYLLSTWDRPAFMLLYAAPAQLGIEAARLMSLGPAAIAIAGTMLAARDLELPRPWLAGILVGAQLDFFGQASSTMTELLFAAAFAPAIWGYVSWRPWIAAAGLGALSVSRPEGPLFAALGAAGLWIRYRRVGPCIASVAPFVAFLVVGAVTLRDPQWYLHENAYRSASDGARLRLEWKQLWTSFFYTAWRDSQPAVMVLLEALGAVLVMGRRWRRFLFLLAPLAASWFLLTFLRIGEADWWRQSRYLVAMAPALALLAAVAVAWATEALPATAPPVILIGAAASAAATVLERRRPAIAWGAAGAVVVFGVLVALGFLLWTSRRRVPFEISLTALLVVPLVASPPGAFGRHMPTAAERLDLAAVRWLVTREPQPVAVGWDTPALQSACLAEVDRPCPLALRVISPSDARPGAMYVRQFTEREPDAPPPGWRIAWSAEDGSIRGPRLRPRWVPVHAVIWEKQ